MIYQKMYEFDIIWNSTQAGDIDPANYSFSIRDSIHKLYSEITFTIADLTGVLQETLTSVENIKLEIKYGLNGPTQQNTTLLSCPFTIINDETPKIYSNDSIGGKLVLKGLHDWYSYQEVKSKGYNNRISNIIQDLTSNYTFSNSSVISNNADVNRSKFWNDTGCDTFWYQPLMNQHDFIYDILLPNAYSNNSYDTPFFCYITSNNEFCLKNYKAMTNESVQTYKLVNFYPQDLGLGIIFDLKRYRPGSLITKKLRNRTLFYRNRDTGAIEQAADSIASYPKDTQYLPIIQDSLTSSSYDLLFKETENNLLECFNGRKINSMKDTLFLEKYIMTVPLNTNIHAGQSIKLDLPIKNLYKNSNDSIYFSGNYLVEETDHVWDGGKRTGYSQFIVSRKSTSITNDSLIKSKLFHG